MEADRRPHLLFVWENRNVAAHSVIVSNSPCTRADALERESKKNRSRKILGPQFLSFVKEGTTKLTVTIISRTCIMQDSNDLEMRAE
ncbi:hypothetical protein DPMN_080456 [Dreissena polymorpha]|uniref:Uncharacterized protein n=1 Tax=Dreissena polymorpha TaxID=45954 RepID=A0A9D3YVN6_DREPO|nr:hypothetical protein DPMN_080456 [Dreissena polymorpha]